MILDTKNIDSKGLRLTDSIDLDETLLVENDSLFIDKINYSIFFTREGQKIKAKGTIKTLVSLTCVRCLEDFEMKVNSSFDIILFPTNLIEQSTSALNTEDMEYIFYDGNGIDITKILTEQVNLFIPYNPTCKTNCKGMCPNCGSNLNFEQCKCEKSLNELSLLFDKIKR